MPATNTNLEFKRNANATKSSTLNNDKVSPASALPSAVVFTWSHERVAARAQEIWRAKGCRPGEDEQNWREAEDQLRAEAVRS